MTPAKLIQLLQKVPEEAEIYCTLVGILAS